MTRGQYFKQMGEVARKVGLSLEAAHRAYRSGAMKYTPAFEPGGIASFEAEGRRWVQKPDGSWLEAGRHERS